MSPRRLLVSFLVASQLTGCYSITADLRDGSVQPAAARERRIVRTVDREERCWFILAGLLPLNQPDIRAISQDLRADERLGGSRTISEYGPVDIAFAFGGILLGGIVAGALGAVSGNASTASLIGSLIGFLIPTSRTLKVTADVIVPDSPTARPKE
jgi:hypothetical protein